MRLVIDETAVQNADPLVNPISEHKAAIHEGHLGLFDRKERAIQEDKAGHGNSRTGEPDDLASGQPSRLTYLA
jgi:hypothetical protein